MRFHDHYVSTLLVLSLGCGGGVAPATVGPGAGAEPTSPGGSTEPTSPGGGAERTGLEGTAYRGPIRPVCRVENPCNAPFSATFEVRQGERVVASFQSDAAGHFLVHLDPGTYSVVPDASAPLLARSQVHEVTVEPSGLTHVVWEFDTGIR